MYRRNAPLLPDPLVRSHPFARGLLCWLTGAASRGGGAAWYGLAAGRNGAATNSHGWASAADRFGGAGLCPTYVAASSQWTAIPGLDAAMDGLSACTVLMWTFRTAGTTAGFGRGETDASRFNVQWGTSNTLNGFIGAGRDYSPASAATGWQHWGVSYDGAAATKFVLYLNGVDRGYEGTGVSATTIPTAVGTGLGRLRSTGSYAYATGAHDDLAVWGRALSAAEVRAWYESSRAGHPGLLRRVERPAWARLYRPRARAMQRMTRGGGL